MAVGRNQSLTDDGLLAWIRADGGARRVVPTPCVISHGAVAPRRAAPAVARYRPTAVQLGAATELATPACRHDYRAIAFNSAALKRAGSCTCGEWPRSANSISVAFGIAAAARLPSLA